MTQGLVEQRPFSTGKQTLLSTSLTCSPDSEFTSVSSRHPSDSRNQREFAPRLSFRQILLWHLSKSLKHLSGRQDSDLLVNLRRHRQNAFTSCVCSSVVKGLFLVHFQFSTSTKIPVALKYVPSLKIFMKKNFPENQSLPFCCRGVTTKEVEERADLLWLVPGHCQQEDPQHHGQPQCPSCSQALPHLGQEG